MLLKSLTSSCGVAALSIAASLAAHAEQRSTLLPEIIITADQFAVAAKAQGSAVTVIGGDAIAESKAVSAVDVLRAQPGISLSQAGARGGLTEIRMRGAESNHVLVIVDGIEVNRPGEGGFDFSTLAAENIERIEIIRGPQSGLYGSNAVAGVISVITKSGKGLNGYAGRLRVEGGTRDSGAASASIRGGNDHVHGSITASGFTTGGDNPARLGAENDGSDDLHIFGKGGVRIGDNAEIEGVFRYVDRRVETDMQDFRCLSADFPCTVPSPTYGMLVDAGDVTDYTDFSGRVTGRVDTFGGAWTHEITAAFNRVTNDFRAEVDPVDNDSGVEEGRDTFSYKTVLRLDGGDNVSHTLSGLIEHQHETFRNTHEFATPDQRTLKTRDTLSFAAEYLIELFDAVSLTAAVRHDDNERFVDATTWRLTGAWTLPNGTTRLHGSWGTGVANPTFYELYGFFPAFFVGNPSLTPERSRGFDIGVEQQFLNGDLVVDVTWFEANLTNEIATDFNVFPFTAINLDGESKRRGLEVSAAWQVLPWLTISGAYNYLVSLQPDGSRELRRPRHSGRVDATARFAEGRGRVSVGVQYSADMLDTMFAAAGNSIVRVDDFVVVNASANWQLNDRTEIYVRAENLFNESYEEIYSYRAPGTTAYAGVNIKFGSGD